MIGLIRTRHLVLHAPLILRLFGFRAYVRCVAGSVRHPGATTFLSAVPLSAQPTKRTSLSA
jgi:hypothetical protein